MHLSYEFINNLAWERLDATGMAGEYGEPGYDMPTPTDPNPTPCVIFGNYWHRKGSKWDRILSAKSNRCPSWFDSHPRIFAQLEAQGVDLPWCDEWMEIGDKAYRSTHDSYGWQPSWFWAAGWDEPATLADVEECGLDLLTSSFVNNPRTAINLRGFNPTVLLDAGWKQVNGVFQNGWHPGQDDDPATLTEAWRKANPDDDILFVIDGVGQFDIDFLMFVKSVDTETEGE
jgi:hypothetical protein